MKIIVSIKQVPDSSNVVMDPETGTMKREGVSAVVNPDDLSAVEAALQIKDKRDDVTVTAITMGPPAAETALREVLAMGVDEAVLLTDRKFGGADTWATSYTLASCIRKLGGADLIICGERATDGETGQVGPEMSAHLHIPLATYISSIVDVEDDYIRMIRSADDGKETLRSPYPILITVGREIGAPRLGSIRAKLAAKRKEITVWTAADLDVEPEKIGLAGSPTKVVKIFTPKISRQCDMFEVRPDNLEQAKQKFIQFLEDKEIADSLAKLIDEGSCGK